MIGKRIRREAYVSFFIDIALEWLAPGILKKRVLHRNLAANANPVGRQCHRYRLARNRQYIVGGNPEQNLSLPGERQ